ncbi:alpha/beta hydrolase-fold protein [Bacillus sp. FSL W7-1360]
MSSLQGTLLQLTIESTYLNHVLSLPVYRPANYTPLKSYGLLICQDGHDYFRLGRIARQAEELMEDMEIEETIIVGVPYPDIATRRAWYHPESPISTHYSRFLACELLPFIEQTFSTEIMAHARTLAGDSLAATASLQCALAYPSLFGRVILHSPYVNQPLLNTVEAYNKTVPLTIYHAIGTEETNVTLTTGEKADFLTPNRVLHQLLTRTPFSYTYKEFSGDHTWTHWQKDLPHALKNVLST